MSSDTFGLKYSEFRKHTLEFAKRSHPPRTKFHFPKLVTQKDEKKERKKEKSTGKKKFRSSTLQDIVERLQFEVETEQEHWEPNFGSTGVLGGRNLADESLEAAESLEMATYIGSKAYQEEQIRKRKEAIKGRGFPTRAIIKHDDYKRIYPGSDLNPISMHPLAFKAYTSYQAKQMRQQYDQDEEAFARQVSGIEDSLEAAFHRNRAQVMPSSDLTRSSFHLFEKIGRGQSRFARVVHSVCDELRASIFHDNPGQVMKNTPTEIEGEHVEDYGTCMADVVKDLLHQQEELSQAMKKTEDRFNHMENHEGKNLQVLNLSVLRWQSLIKFHYFMIWRSNIYHIKRQRKKLATTFARWQKHQLRNRSHYNFHVWKARVTEAHYESCLPGLKKQTKHYDIQLRRQQQDQENVSHNATRVKVVHNTIQQSKDNILQLQYKLKEVTHELEEENLRSCATLTKIALKTVKEVMHSLVDEVEFCKLTYKVDPLRLLRLPRYKLKPLAAAQNLLALSEETFLKKWVNYHLVMNRNRRYEEAKEKAQVQFNLRKGDKKKTIRKPPALRIENFGSDLQDFQALLTLLEEIAPTHTSRRYAAQSKEEFDVEKRAYRFFQILQEHAKPLCSLIQVDDILHATCPDMNAMFLSRLMIDFFSLDNEKIKDELVKVTRTIENVRRKYNRMRKHISKMEAALKKRQAAFDDRIKEVVENQINITGALVAGETALRKEYQEQRELLQDKRDLIRQQLEKKEYDPDTGEELPGLSGETIESMIAEQVEPDPPEWKEDLFTFVKLPSEIEQEQRRAARAAEMQEVRDQLYQEEVALLKELKEQEEKEQKRAAKMAAIKDSAQALLAENAKNQPLTKQQRFENAKKAVKAEAKKKEEEEKKDIFELVDDQEKIDYTYRPSSTVQRHEERIKVLKETIAQLEMVEETAETMVIPSLDGFPEMIDSLLVTLSGTFERLRRHIYNAQQRQDLWRKIKCKMRRFTFVLLASRARGMPYILSDAKSMRMEDNYCQVNFKPLHDLYEALTDKKDEIEADQAEISQVLRLEYPKLESIFRSYAQGELDTNLLEMSFVAFQAFCRDCKFGKSIKVAVLNECFLHIRDQHLAILLERLQNEAEEQAKANQAEADAKGELDPTFKPEGEKKSILSSDHAALDASQIAQFETMKTSFQLTCIEWVHSLLRIAFHRFQGAPTLSGRFKLLLEMYVLPNANALSLEEFQILSRTPECLEVFRKHSRRLKRIFMYFSALDSGPSKLKQLGMINYYQFQKMLAMLRLIGNQAENCITVNDAKLLFVNLRRLDNEKISNAYLNQIKLNYSGWLQSLVGVAMFKIPDPYLSIPKRVDRFLIKILLHTFNRIAVKK